MGNVIASFRKWNQEFPCSLKKKKKARVEEEPALPIEVMMEIINRLPLKPLARAQLVCKQWRSLIQEHQFMENHMRRCRHFSYWCKWSRTNTQAATAARARPSYLHGCDGLLLVRNRISNLYLIWNPASRLVLDLPTPQNHSYGVALCFVPSTKNYKIASFFRDRVSERLGCELLTLGPSIEWRRLEFPDLVYENKNVRPRVVPAGGDVHCVLLDKKGKENVAEIVSLDVETELLTVNLLPGGLFGDAKAIDCEGKLGFGVVDKREMEVMVLENYKKKRWGSKKGVIPLPFLKDKGFEGKKLFPLMIKEGEIWFWLEKERVFAYTIETGKRRGGMQCKGVYSFSRKLYSYKPSLVRFEGMRSDADEEYLDEYRPRNIRLE